MLQRLKAGLTRTKQALISKVEMVVRRAVSVDDNFWEEIEETLILSDCGMAVSVEIVEKMRQRHKVEKPQDVDSLMAMLRGVLAEMLQPESDADPLAFSEGTNVIMLTGVNGSGKTTSCGKLAAHFTAMGKKVIIAACDTFRAAAVDQLEVWATRADVPIIRQKEGTDPSAVMFDAAMAAKSRGADILIADTAGRLHTKSNLMEELKKMKRICVEKAGMTSFRSWLVLDSTLGQNALSQVRLFNEAVPVDALVLTKLDGTAKGGIVFSIISELKIPIAYIGVGEKLEDLMRFDPHEFSQALLGDRDAREEAAPNAT